MTKKNEYELIFYTVENTGYSNGVSWFGSYGYKRFDNHEEAYKLAFENAEESRKSHKSWMIGWEPHPEEPDQEPPKPMLHRVTMHRIHFTDNSKIHYEFYDIV